MIPDTIPGETLTCMAWSFDPGGKIAAFDTDATSSFVVKLCTLFTGNSTSAVSEFVALPFRIAPGHPNPLLKSSPAFAQAQQDFGA
jgi:hypothetical protein